MILRSSEVQQFRCHNRPFEIAFHPRITVVAGPNEAGKSTLFEALRYAFFRRSNATGGDILRLGPWDTQGLTPEVKVTFEHCGAEYRLVKRFGKNGTTQLERRLENGSFAPYMGADADAFVRNIFANELPGAGRFGGFTGSTLGLAQLLFVPQAAIAIPEVAQSELSSEASAAISRIVATATQSPAAAQLSAKIKAAYASEWSQRGLRKNSPAAQAAAAVVVAEQRVQDARRRLTEFEALASRFSEVRDEADESTRLAFLAEENVKRQRPMFEDAATLREAVAEAERAFAAASAAYETLCDRRRRVECAAVTREELAPKLALLQHRVAATTALLEEATQRREAALRHLQERSEPDAACIELRTAIEIAHRARDHETAFNQLQERLNAIRKLDGDLSEMRSRYASLTTIGDDEVRKIRQLQGEHTRLAALVAASETTLRFVAERPVTVVASEDGNDESIQLVPGEKFERLSTQTLRLRIEGVGMIECSGPAGDAARLRDALSACEDELKDIAERAGGWDADLLASQIAQRTMLEQQLRDGDAKRKELLGRDDLNELAVRAESERIVVADAVSSESIDELRARLRDVESARELAIAAAKAASADATTAQRTAELEAREAQIAEARLREGPVRECEVALAAAASDGMTDDEHATAERTAWTVKAAAEQRLRDARDAYAPHAGFADPLSELSRLSEEARMTAVAAERARGELEKLSEEINAFRELAPAEELGAAEEARARPGRERGCQRRERRPRVA